MKKIFLGAILMLGFAVGANAQVNVGIKGGVNYSEVNSANFNSSSVAGYQAGIFARFGNSVYLQPEVYVSSTGGKYHAEDDSYSGNVRFTKLNVPVLVGLKFGSDDLNFRVMAGPIYSYNMSTSKSFSTNVNGAFVDFGQYNNSTLGLQGGFGVDIGPITTDLRYEGGLSKVNDNYGQRQSLWALSVGFKFL